jgi:pyruvate/2-oxoglutarate dehydrogenase complex dihydrolipoamide dehydrogenase (E3) component
MLREFDAILIGTGQAAPSLAARLAETGMRVAIIERHRFGGTCVNIGCIPPKTMIASAYVAHTARRARDYGVNFVGDVTVDMEAVKARKVAISGGSSRDLEDWLRHLKNVTVFVGTVRFKDAATVRVNTDTLRADKISINVGGRAYVPPLSGIEQTPFLTNSTMMDVDFLPKHLTLSEAAMSAWNLRRCSAVLDPR